MKPYGPYVAARTLYDGVVRTMRGMDRVTGMPVLIYTLPARIEPPHLIGRRLVPYSDQGWEQGVYFLVSELPLHAVPAGDPLLAARGALDALTELHADGLVHGGLTPAQLWSVDGDVRLTGAGLPWGPLVSGYEAPEGGQSPQADLYTLGCTLEALGGVPDALRGLLNPDPHARPSAREALELLDRPAIRPVVEESVVTVPTHPDALPDSFTDGVLDLLGEPEAATAVTPPADPEPVVIDVQVPEATPDAEPPAPVPEAVQSQTVAAVPTIRMGFDEPAGRLAAGSDLPPRDHVAPPPVVQAQVTEERAEVNPRRQPIRIGWEEDNSWRVVRAPEEDTAAVKPPSRARALLGPLLAVVALLLLAGGLLWWRLAAVQPRLIATCCSVAFRVSGGNARVNITVLSSPGGSGLAKGDLIGSVPGTLQFPDTRGTYTLRAEAEGYSPMQFAVTVPNTQPVEIDLKK